LIHALGETMAKQCVRFTDESGNKLMLRPDHTTPIARIAATRLKDTDKPVRFYYADSVFRKNSSQEGVEIFQSGIELLGDSTIESDAEAIMMCIESLLNIGLDDIHVDISHQDILEALSENERQALKEGNYIDFGRMPERGDVTIIQDHKSLVELNDILTSHNMQQYISFNKGLIKEYRYYTGVIFECYVPGCGRPFASGGRYDQLIQKFGYDCPAVGFAISVNDLLRVKRGSQ